MNVRALCWAAEVEGRIEVERAAINSIQSAVSILKPISGCAIDKSVRRDEIGLRSGKEGEPDDICYHQYNEEERVRKTVCVVGEGRFNEPPIGATS